MPPKPFVIFLDENHCNNQKILHVLRTAEIAVERHLDHFARGTPDEDWLPFVGKNDWALLTTDARIRYRSNEKRAVQENAVRMFYFSTNNLSGQQMADVLAKALPAMRRLFITQTPPFFAAITRNGTVNLREKFTAP